jgi:hypothetical protein
MPLVVERPFTVEPGSPLLGDLLKRCATDDDAARRLRARVLLHLPRLADKDGRLGIDQVESEVRRLADEQSAAPAWLSPPESLPLSPVDLELTELDPGRARELHERFHYLRSHREGLHLAGAIDGRLAVQLTFSTLDLHPIRTALPGEMGSASALVLSRAYTTAWAPRNSLSRVLALAARELRARDPGLCLLLTYLNPGAGFDGASYKAANWCLYGREHGTRYAYLDESYVTDRELTRRFGTSDATALRLSLADRIAFSRMALQPLELFALALRPRLRRALALAPQREWMRPWG